MADDDGWAKVLGFGAALFLGYAVVKALTERPCPACGKSTAKDNASCRHCGAWVGATPMDDPEVALDPVSRGAQAAKYASGILPLGAFGGAIFAFQNPQWWGQALGIIASLYLVIWLLANGSALVLITVRNWYATHNEIRDQRGQANPKELEEAEESR